MAKAAPKPNRGGEFLAPHTDGAIGGEEEILVEGAVGGVEGLKENAGAPAERAMGLATGAGADVVTGGTVSFGV